jgi:hypothetical protein
MLHRWGGEDIGKPDILQLVLQPLQALTTHIDVWENSLFDTTLNFDSLFNTKKLFLPYSTTGVNFFPYMTLPSTLLGPTVSFVFLRPNYPFIYPYAAMEKTSAVS